MYRLLIIIGILLIGWGLFSVSGNIIVRYAGKKVMTVIIATPSKCDKYNYIKVLLDSTEYEVSISRINCRNGIYKVGQRIELLKYKDYKKLEWPGSHPELVIIFIIATLIIGYFNAQRFYKGSVSKM